MQIAKDGMIVNTKFDRRDGWGEPVLVMVDEAGGFDDDAAANGFRVGNIVEVCGIGTKEGSVRGWFVWLSPPGAQWQVKLRKPFWVVAGTEQEFIVDGVIKNTGKQTLRNLQVGVRLWQIGSPNDFVEPYVIPVLKPGEVHRFKVPFAIYNYQAIGWTSVPRVDATVLGYEL